MFASFSSGNLKPPAFYWTDKFTFGYVPTYQRIAEELGPAARVCEVGVRSGGSLAMWQDLFPQGLIVGVDNDEGCHWPEGTRRLVMDQTDPELPFRLAQFSNLFDLIVEDASHEGQKSQRTYDLLQHMVAPGGYYVIEDWMVGFPSWSGSGPRQPSMLDMAHWFLGLLERPDGDIESVTYRYGQIIIRRKVNV